MIAYYSQMRAAAFLCSCVNRLIQRCSERLVMIKIAEWFGFGRHGFQRTVRFRFKNFGVDKAVAGVDEGFGRLFLAKTIDSEAILSDTSGKACEVAVAGDKAKASQFPRMQQIHCVDDQRTVAGILPDSVTELLNRLDRMLRQH